jgi:xylulokinase
VEFVIGCDLGSQSVKAVLVDADGKVRGTASVSLEMAHRHPGWADQDAGEWLTAVGRVVRALREATGVPASSVRALAFASQVDGVVAVNQINRPVAPAIIWMDRRATRQAMALQERVGIQTLLDTTGLNPDAYHVAPKLAWLREEGGAASADAYLLPGSFLVASLTGERVIDHANASCTMLYDVGRRTWAPRLLDAAEVGPEHLGRLAEASEVAGYLTEAAAADLGLTADCHVAVGTGDEHGACLGAGALDRGVVVDITGTAEPVAAATREPVFDAERLVETHAHAAPGTWLIENPGFVSGGSVRWLADVLGATQQHVLALAGSAPPGSGGVVFLPTLSGSMTPRWDASARGVFSGLAMSTSPAHLARAVLEGCTYALRDLVDRLEALGLDGELRVVGGGGRSGEWMQLKADVTGRAVRSVLADEATAVGAAMLAATAVGMTSSLQEAADAMVRLASHSVEPTDHPGVRETYAVGYAAYRRLFDAVEPTFGGAS